MIRLLSRKGSHRLRAEGASLQADPFFMLLYLTLIDVYLILAILPECPSDSDEQLRVCILGFCKRMVTFDIIVAFILELSINVSPTQNENQVRGQIVGNNKIALVWPVEA